MKHVKIVSICIVALFFTAACGTSKSGVRDVWPTVDALPRSQPKGIKQPESGTVLQLGSDGYLYAVGNLGDAKEGSPFYARYAGNWPLEDLPRPPMASGHILKKYDDVALVSLDYVFPDANVDGLMVTWETPPMTEELGKGIAPVIALNPTADSDAQLSVGEELGVQPGDIYAILGPITGKSPNEIQITRRVKAICLVNEVTEDRTTCRAWRGSTMVPGIAPMKVGDVGVFLEHTFGNAPRAAKIQIAQIEGDKKSKLRETLNAQFSAYMKSLSFPNAVVKNIDVVTDARALTFHQQEQNVQFNGEPTVIIGGSIVKVDGKKHLFVNYTGIGPASGPGMVAAPPEGGIDLGPVAAIDENKLRAFAGVVWSAVLVYRGQTSEALMHLRLLLNDKSVTDSLRWHARDQYAMRWAALGYEREALWLVQQDEAMAKKADNETAYLNALGTRVRLYDLLELPDNALTASTEYLAYREKERPNSSYMSALGMHAEMLAGVGDLEQAEDAVNDLVKLCPEGCNGDLSSMLTGVFWAIPDGKGDFRDRLLKEIVGLARVEAGPKLASARLYQGLNALRADLLEDALLAFAEAERLFVEANYLTGVARTKYFTFLTQLSRKEPQKAFDAAIEAIQTGRELRDFDSASLVYERLAALYTGFDPNTPTGPYLGAAEDVLAAGIQTQLAKGNFAKSAEALFSLGTFLMKIGKLTESQISFQRGVYYAIRSTRFDVAALCHLSLGVIARERNDKETYADEMRRAVGMSELSGDPSVREIIERVLNPTEDNDVPTKLL